ncbi:MAG: hypothetical protein OXU23_10260 [Candidatus Poribacteria bacterium]|nr:hypothetical protein [Candidatus Poribacteria bacterium]
MNLIKDEKEAKGFPYFQLIALGSGVAVGTPIGDPTGISAGAIGVFGGWGLERFITPFISKRQTVRLFQWGIQASENISQRLENGEKFRDDGFFSETPTNRSKMDEAVESTLKKVMEQQKNPR